MVKNRVNRNKQFLSSSGEVAEKELSKSEKNVDKELEDYRRSLLKYRYEQKYVNQRLDTAVTDAQIEKYYEAHIETFKLSLPIAKARFLDKLKGVEDPQRKRQIIGAEFGYVFLDEALKFGITKEDFFAQGTIYPDVIESGAGDADVIKSHHNKLLP